MSDRKLPVLGPDATIGILGGGQLGRMLALAAAKFGLKCHVMSPDPASPAFDVVHRVTNADYTDPDALDRFAGDVDVITYEFENIPAETATFLSARKPVLPDPGILAITQDRLFEKNFVAKLGIETAPLCIRRCSERIVGGTRHDRPACGAQDPPLRLRRQRSVDGARRHRSRRRMEGDRRTDRDPRSLCPFRARDLGGGGPQRRRPDRMLRRYRERTSRPHPRRLARTRRGVSRSRHGRARDRAQDRRCLRLRRRVRGRDVRGFGRLAAIACWSTRSRPGCTIPATGRSTAPPSRNSSSTSGPLQAGRSPSRSGSGGSR